MIIADGVIYSFFRMGLATGILERRAVVAWADRMILERDKLTEEIMELSLSEELPYSQIIKDLNLYQEPMPDHGLALKLLLGYAGVRLDQNPDCAIELARGLRLLLAEYFLSKELRSSLTELDNLVERYLQKQVAVDELSLHLEGFLQGFGEYRAPVREIID